MTAPIDAAVVVAPDAALPTATLENVVVAGELDAAKATEMVAALVPDLARCLGSAGPTTTELSLTIIKSGIGLRAAWQNDTPSVPPCLQSIFADPQQRAWNVGSTTVYAVVKATPPGTTAPEAPKLAERRAEFVRLFCDLEKLAGAEALEPIEKRNAMQTWARDHIKHPAPLQLASDVSTWSPSDMNFKLEKALLAEGIKKCSLQRW